MGKVIYAKEFMYLHRASVDWCGKMELSSTLLVNAIASSSELLRKERESTPVAPGVSRENRRLQQALKEQREELAGNIRKKPKLAKTASDRAAAELKRTQNLRTVTCFSRSDPSVQACTYTDCRFSHDCVSCGANHLAKDCPSWDSSKTRRNPKG